MAFRVFWNRLSQTTTRAAAAELPRVAEPAGHAHASAAAAAAKHGITAKGADDEQTDDSWLETDLHGDVVAYSEISSEELMVARNQLSESMFGRLTGPQDINVDLSDTFDSDSDASSDGCIANSQMMELDRQRGSGAMEDVMNLSVHLASVPEVQSAIYRALKEDAGLQAALNRAGERFGVTFAFDAVSGLNLPASASAALAHITNGGGAAATDESAARADGAPLPRRSAEARFMELVDQLMAKAGGFGKEVQAAVAGFVRRQRERIAALMFRLQQGKKQRQSEGTPSVPPPGADDAFNPGKLLIDAAVAVASVLMLIVMLNRRSARAEAA